MLESYWGIPTFYLLGLIGIVTGFFSGLLGLGGGWLMTPLMSILGYPAPLAIGTTMAQMAATAAVGGFTHFRAGRLVPQLAVVMTVAMVIGVLIGNELTGKLAAAGAGDAVLKWIHFCLSAFLGTQILMSAIRGSADRATAAWILRLRELRFGPVLSIGLGRTTPALIPALSGLIAGIASGVAGIGGGIILFPIMVTIVGMTPRETVATNLVCMIFSAGIGAIAYAHTGHVDFRASGYIFVGSFVGSYLGAKVLGIVKDRAIRFMFAGMLLMTSLSLALRLAGFATVSTVSIFSSAILAFLGATSYIVIQIAKNRRS